MLRQPVSNFIKVLRNLDIKATIQEDECTLPICPNTAKLFRNESKEISVGKITFNTEICRITVGRKVKKELHLILISSKNLNRSRKIASGYDSKNVRNTSVILELNYGRASSSLTKSCSFSTGK